MLVHPPGGHYINRDTVHSKFAVGENFIGAVRWTAARFRARVAALFFWYCRPVSDGESKNSDGSNFFIMLIFIIGYLIIIPQYGIIGAVLVYSTVPRWEISLLLYLCIQISRTSFV